MHLKTMNRITIDPGLHSTGYAIWNSQSFANCNVDALKLAGLVKGPAAKPDDDFMLRAQEVAKQVLYVARRYNVVEGWIEFPVFYASSAGGHMAAASGDLQKLCAVAGAIAGILASEKILIHSVLVPEWKGQLPKVIVNKRIIDIVGKDRCTYLKLEKDAWDAVGLGLWKMGWLNQR